jgi:hypothetical protein
MAPVIWGLPLADIKWSAFSTSNMWNNTYHMRRTKFLVYQGAMIFCVVSESLGTDALSNYVDQQKKVQKDYPGANVSNNDIVGSFSYNIFAGVFVATIFGAAFFFDLFWPERRESRSVQLAWKICSVLAVLFVLASAINLTVIIATHQAYLTGTAIPRIPLDPVLDYKKNGEAIASVVLVWIGWLFTMWRYYLPSQPCLILILTSHTCSSYLMITCTSYIAANGPFSKHARGSGARNARTTTGLETGDATVDSEGKKSMEGA